MVRHFFPARVFALRILARIGLTFGNSTVMTLMDWVRERINGLSAPAYLLPPFFNKTQRLQVSLVCLWHWGVCINGAWWSSPDPHQPMTCSSEPRPSSSESALHPFKVLLTHIWILRDLIFRIYSGHNACQSHVCTCNSGVYAHRWPAKHITGHVVQVSGSGSSI